MTTVKTAVMVVLVSLVMAGALQVLRAEQDLVAAAVAVDPGVRGGVAGAGGRINGLTATERAFFAQSRLEFEGPEGCRGRARTALQPR